MERFSTEGTTETWYEVSDGQALSDGVVRAVSAVTGLLPAVPMGGDVGTDSVLDPLAATIDPDGLDRLFDPCDDDAVASITFSYHGQSVMVDSTGTVRVTPEDETAESLLRARVPAPESRLEEAGQ